MTKRVIITCGPSRTPLDALRFITNPSTGELGALLADAFAAARHHVICLRGIDATFSPKHADVDVRTFDTNTALLARLREVKNPERIDAVFHVAALGDFTVGAVTQLDGTPMDAAKLPSRQGSLLLRLDPAEKIIAHLRPLFPKATVVGWKFEMDGDRTQAIARALKQIRENNLSACVVNGTAYGPGFGVLTPDGSLRPLPDKPSLCEHLLHC